MPYSKTASAMTPATDNINKAKAINTNDEKAKAMYNNAMQPAALVQTNAKNTATVSQNPPRDKKQEKKLRAERAKAKKEQALQVQAIATAKKAGKLPETPFSIPKDDTATATGAAEAAPSSEDTDAVTNPAEVTIQDVVAPESADSACDSHDQGIENTDEDVEMEDASFSEVDFSKLARLLKKRQKDEHRAQVVQSNGKPLKHKPQKKNRKPLDASAKKDHSKVDNVVKLVDREFDKTMTVLDEVRGDKIAEPRRLLWGLSQSSRSLSTSRPVSPSSPVSSCEDSPVSQPLPDEETALSASSVFVPLPDIPFSLLEESDASEAVETVSSTEDVDKDIGEIIVCSPKIAAAIDNVLNSPPGADDEASSPTNGDVECLSISEELIIDIPNADHVEQPVDKPTAKKSVDERPFNFFLFPNAAEYPSVLSRDEEAALTAMYVGEFVPPVSDHRPSRPSRAERRAAKIKYVCGNLRDWDKEAELAAEAEAEAKVDVTNEKPANEDASVNNEKQVPEAEVKAPVAKPKRPREPVPEPEDDVLVECAPHMSTQYLEQDKPSTRVRKALEKKAQEKSDNQTAKLLALVAKTEYDPAYDIVVEKDDIEDNTAEEDIAAPIEQVDTTSEQIDDPLEDTSSEQVELPSEELNIPSELADASSGLLSFPSEPFAIRSVPSEQIDASLEQADTLPEQVNTSEQVDAAQELLNTPSEQMVESSSPTVAQAHESMSKNAIKKAARLERQKQAKANKKAAKEAAKVATKEAQQSAAIDEETEMSSAIEHAAEDGNQALDEQPLESLAVDVPLPPSAEHEFTALVNSFVAPEATITIELSSAEDVSFKAEEQDTSAEVHELAIADPVPKESICEEPIITETLDEDPLEPIVPDVFENELPIAEELIVPVDDSTVKQELKAIDDNNPSSSDEDTTLHPASKSGARFRRDSSASLALTIEDLEREEHLAGTTYIGSTSLEDFMDKLEFDPENGTTTKQDICTAFAVLSTEEFEAIQHRPAGHIAADELRSPSVQRKIKLGKTSLYNFLRSISYDTGSTTVNAVMEAFGTAAASDRKVSKKMRLALQLAAAANS